MQVNIAFYHYLVPEVEMVRLKSSLLREAQGECFFLVFPHLMSGIFFTSFAGLFCFNGTYLLPILYPQLYIANFSTCTHFYATFFFFFPFYLFFFLQLYHIILLLCSFTLILCLAMIKIIFSCAIDSVAVLQLAYTLLSAYTFL